MGGSVCIAYIYLKSYSNIQVYLLYFHSVVYEFDAWQLEKYIVNYSHLGPVQTPNFSWAEPNTLN